MGDAPSHVHRCNDIPTISLIPASRRRPEVHVVSTGAADRHGAGTGVAYRRRQQRHRGGAPVHSSVCVCTSCSRNISICASVSSVAAPNVCTRAGVILQQEDIITKHETSACEREYAHAVDCASGERTGTANAAVVVAFPLLTQQKDISGTTTGEKGRTDMAFLVYSGTTTGEKGRTNMAFLVSSPCR